MCEATGELDELHQKKSVRGSSRNADAGDRQQEQRYDRITVQRRNRLRVVSFDDLVGAHEERLGNNDPERFRGHEVDNHLEPRRAFDGQVGRFGAA
jgi:hypothetical protein